VQGKTHAPRSRTPDQELQLLVRTALRLSRRTKVRDPKVAAELQERAKFLEAFLEQAERP
jgi:hypothetical protein